MAYSPSAADVKKLRELTDLPMMDCKKALAEAEGDFDKAIDVLRSQVGKLMLKRSENATSEGRIVQVFSPDHTKAAMIELQCESEPVSRSEDFVGFAKMCAQQLLDGPGAATPDELLAQTAAGQSKPLKEIYEEIVNKIREKIILSKIVRVDGAGFANGYIHHDGKNGALFFATGEKADLDLLRDVAMHVTALKPRATHPEELDQAEVKAERDKLTAEAKATGKPDNIVEKIVDGRMKTFYDQNGVLTYQLFAKDDSKTVKQALAEKGLTAKQFVRWVIGN